MAQFVPITLLGATLGERHQYLNSQVDKAAKDLLSFQDIEEAPEQTAVDRIFKIDLAIKLKNTDFIIKNLKDDDMLYVCRALKCKWLLERRDIINPKYLDDVLFPEMLMPAISKMKHWLYINLRDPAMCQEFYQYYKETKFDFAIKFLSHCDNEFVLNEFPKILIKLTPHYLKVFAEKSPEFAKIYFDSLATEDELVQRYLQGEQLFYNSIKSVLKTNPDVFLDITEKYQNIMSSKKFSPSATDYILRFHKNRFMAKPELYVVYLLHIPTVARCLSIEECQDVVLKLARADYLSWWFSYPNVEPLVKRVNRDKRAAFKKRVFMEKDVGVHVAEWPYVLPASPVEIANNTNATCFQKGHVFDDREYAPIMMQDFTRSMLKKRKYCKWACREDICKKNTELQKLFNDFRFVGFAGTLHELKTRIGATSSADRRRDMLLVLVSKSGGRADAIQALLQLALRLRNEPVHERAAVVRSLVKRTNAWRLPQDVWDMMLEYAEGLGLDGSKPEADCSEGLHAVVIRQLIATGDCEPAVRTAFLDKFSTFAEYKLVESERTKIGAGLQNILVSVASEAQPDEAANYLGQLLDVLEKYHIRLESSQAVSAVAALAERESNAARPLLIRLYKARVGRRELLRQYLEFRHDDAALLNVLRHNPNVITPEWFVKLLVDGETRANQFLLKLAIYYNETGGIAEQVRRLLQEEVAQKPNVNLARSLATLAGSDIYTLWCKRGEAGGEHKKLTAALLANMHRARPAPNALALGWRKAGMKAVASCAMRCRPAQVTQLVQTLLEERAKRPVRLALILAPRTDCAVEIFCTAVTIRPLAVLRAALLYFRRLGGAADLRIWQMIKPIMSTINLISSKGLCHILKNVEWVPDTIKPDYCAVLYLALDNIPNNNNMAYMPIPIRDLIKYQSEVNEDLLENVLLRMLVHIEKKYPIAYSAIVIRYLMLSKSDEQAKIRFDKIGEPYLAKIEAYRLKSDDRNIDDALKYDEKYFFADCLEQVMLSIQYNFAFFDIKYKYCLTVIERVLTWIQDFMPKELFFKHYVKIHATMLYYKAVRQSIAQNREVFEDPVKKMSEGVDIVGFTFGRYIAKEVAELTSEYFDSVIEIYSEGFMEYLDEYIMYGHRSCNFVVGIIKGILSESVGSEARLASHIFHSQYIIETRDEIKALLMKSNAKETAFFINVDIFG